MCNTWLSCTLNTQEVGAGGWEVTGLPQLHEKVKGQPEKCKILSQKHALTLRGGLEKQLDSAAENNFSLL